MKKYASLLIVNLLFIFTSSIAQDTLRIQTPNAGSFELITTQPILPDTLYTVNEYTTSNGSGVQVFKTQGGALRMQNKTSKTLKLQPSQTVYPNPAKDMVMVQVYNGLIQKAELYNYVGVLVASFNANAKENIQLDISTYSSGVYLIKTYCTSGAVLVSKLIH